MSNEDNGNAALSAGPNDTKSTAPETWEKICAFVFGVIFVVVLLVTAFFVPYPTAFQELVFRIVLAGALAGIAAIIPGFLHVDIKGVIRAGGAIAVFVVIFWFNPASVLSKNPRPEHEGRLGNLLEHLNNTPENAVKLRLSDPVLLDFVTPEYAGRTWSDLFTSMCNDPRSRCLSCSTDSHGGQTVVTIDLRADGPGLENRGTATSPVYVCK